MPESRNSTYNLERYRVLKAPTAAELRDHPIVRRALVQAWADSLPASLVHRHEEGGWIYMNIATGEIAVERAASGSQALLDLNNPTHFIDSVVVGKFHTHPNPTDKGWESGPSETDRRTDAFHGVPDLIRADNGVYVSGPDSRNGGLQGGPGYS